MFVKSLLILLAAFCLGGRKILCALNGSSAAPLSLGPSLYWDGIDGSWSTFNLQLGTPPQAVRLLPSITGNTIWAVLPQACQDVPVKSCATDRGGIFTTNLSSTWQNKGFYQLPLNPEHYLPFSGAANFGFDNVTLDWQGNGGMTLESQAVAGYVTEDFYVGALGLSPLSVNLTSFNDQYPSFLGTLKAGNHIPSNSYGYTAGASYRSYPVNAFGSLTLGGYDSTRMDSSKNLTIAGGSDTYRPLLLGIEKITSGSTELLNVPIITALNSVVSQIWLPISVCQHFESAFGLVWNSTYELYIVDETQHSALLAQDPSITFTLSTGSAQNKDDRLNVTLPYAAFDLTAKPPFAGLNETFRYFPLKQAANDTQYTLGRTFLQEAYLIADYDRSALSLFPAVFSDSSIAPKLVPVNPPREMNAITVTNTNTPSGLSRAAMIGIILGSITILIAVAAAILFFFYRNRRHKARKGASVESDPGEGVDPAGARTYHGNELDGDLVAEVKHELASPVDIKHELASPADIKHELASPMDGRTRKDSQISSVISSPMQELEGDHGASELCPHRQIYELP